LCSCKEEFWKRVKRCFRAAAKGEERRRLALSFRNESEARASSTAAGETTAAATTGRDGADFLCGRSWTQSGDIPDLARRSKTNVQVSERFE